MENNSVIDLVSNGESEDDEKDDTIVGGELVEGIAAVGTSNFDSAWSASASAFTACRVSSGGSKRKSTCETSNEEPHQKSRFSSQAKNQKNKTNSCATATPTAVVRRVSPEPGTNKSNNSDASRRSDNKNVAAAAANYVAPAPAPRIWIKDDDNVMITYELVSSLQNLLKRKRSRNNNKYPSSLYFWVTNSTTLQHMQQWDIWSCGFRNIQMLLSALVPIMPSCHPYFHALSHIYCQDVLLHDQDYKKRSHSPHDTLLVLPSLLQLQQQFELSWQEGFDPKGATHFKHAVVGRPSKIGAVEVGYVLSFWSIDACVVQFLRCWASRQLLPAFVYRYFLLQQQEKGGTTTATTTSAASASGTNNTCNKNHSTAKGIAETCTAWAELARDSQPTSLQLQQEQQQFSSTEEDDNTKDDVVVMPMYLQWEGHSVTVIGIEPPGAAATTTTGTGSSNGRNDWGQWNLLVLDPMRSGSHYKTNSTNNNPAAKTPSAAAIVSPYRISCSTLLHRDCQLVVVGRSPLKPDVRQQRKAQAWTVTAGEDMLAKLGYYGHQSG